MIAGTKNAGTAPLFDAVHLAGFTQGDRKLEKMILSEFCANVRSSIQDINSPHPELRWGEAFHRLKGAAKAVGVWSIADWCEAAEQNPEMGEDEKEKLFARMIDLIERIEAQIARF
ncbi:MAG: Hpt domain-containing protein [Sphingomonadales bacterium]|jgi:HPt (histidine-containing phosphotransfer) domain-containing protein